jgi:hypothetical protein
LDELLDHLVSRASLPDQPPSPISLAKAAYQGAPTEPFVCQICLGTLGSASQSGWQVDPHAGTSQQVLICPGHVTEPGIHRSTSLHQGTKDYISKRVSSVDKSLVVKSIQYPTHTNNVQTP